MEKTFIRSYGHIALLIVLGMLLLFVDFITKAYVYHVLPFFEMCSGAKICTHIPIFSNLAGVDFNITPAINKGAAWGFFADFQYILLSVRIVVIFALFLYLFFLNRKPHLNLPLTLVIVGAIGNVVDFFLYGFVIDFLHFDLWGYHFPIFNFADSCITIGVVWLFLIEIFTSKKNKIESKNS